LRECLEGRQRTLGDTHLDTLASTNNLAGLLQALGNLDEAEQLFRTAVDGAMETLGNEHPYTVGMQRNLELLVQDMGKE